MEGNDCYKYRTVQRFVQEAGAHPIESIVEVGANIGDVTLELGRCFPGARIAAYEMMKRYAEIAASRTSVLPQAQVIFAAVTAAHLFHDDLGEVPRTERTTMHGYLALPIAGPGFHGGSFVGERNCQVGAN